MRKEEKRLNEEMETEEEIGGLEMKKVLLGEAVRESKQRLGGLGVEKDQLMLRC